MSSAEPCGRPLPDRSAGDAVHSAFLPVRRMALDPGGPEAQSHGTNEE